MIDVSSFCFIIHAVGMILWTLCEDSTKDQIELGSKGSEGSHERCGWCVKLERRKKAFTSTVRILSLSQRKGEPKVHL